MKKMRVIAVYVMSLNICLMYAAETVEMRGWVDNIENVTQQLQLLGAHLKGEYACTDYIYQPKGGYYDLDKEFVRLRVYDITNWVQKKCAVMHKVKSKKNITGTAVMCKEFDEMKDAQRELDEEYVLEFSFYRHGFEYVLADMRIIVDDIQGLAPSIEIIARDTHQVQNVFAQLSITECTQHSVPFLVQEKYARMRHESGSR